jgi:hypothetical protein
MAAADNAGAGWALGAAIGSAGRATRPGSSRRVVATTLLTSLPVRWSALTTLTKRSAVPPAEGEPATAVATAARIKQKHRKMFPPQYKAKRSIREVLIPDGIISL